MMNETIGTINLKIARLQQRLHLLQQQQLLSRAYPEHWACLMHQATQLQGQLRELMQRREELAHYVTQETINDDFNGSRSIYAVN